MNNDYRNPREPSLIEWLLLLAICAILALFMAKEVNAGAFQDAQSFGASANGHAVSALPGSHVNANTVPGFMTANPPQTAYQNNPGAMSNAASTATATDKTGVGKFIVHSATTRAQFTITANDPLIKNATDIRKHAQQIAGIGASSNPGQCRNVTTTTPDLYRTYTCSNGKTSNVYSNHTCTSGRTPDIFSNHTCTSGRTPDIYSNHRCFTGRRPDIYKNYTCTKSRSVTTSTCDRYLSVTATSRRSCWPGQTLAGNRMYGIAGPGTYGSPGYMDFTAQCGAPGGWTNVFIRGANWLGECWGFRGNYNSRRNVNIPPWGTGYNYAGAIYTIKWSGYFYCMNPAQVYYQSHGCRGNNCSATFRVNDGSETCHRVRSCVRPYTSRSWYCRRHPNNFNCHYCKKYGWKTVCTTNPPKYIGLSWIRSHNIVTYHDQWVNQACR